MFVRREDRLVPGLRPNHSWSACLEEGTAASVTQDHSWTSAPFGEASEGESV